jgi:ferredoxin-type protein NapF
MDRTSFLRKLLMIDSGLEAVNTIRNGGSRFTPPQQIPFTFLRPPGAPLEPTFLARCTRCDLCAEACPENIIIKATEPLMGRGSPIVNPAIAPCTECGKCIEACPDRALLPDEDRRMGRTVWHAETCLSSHTLECTLCVESCPEGSAAIEAVPLGGILIHNEACTGCGFCYHACPTDPKSLHLEGRPPVPLRGHPPVPRRHG